VEVAPDTHRCLTRALRAPGSERKAELIDITVPACRLQYVLYVVAIRLDHCVIAVSDWDEATRFYRDVVGAEVVPIDSERVSFRLGDTQLNVHGPGFMPINNVACLPVQPGNSDLCFVWDGSIEDAVEHLARHGIGVETGPVERRGACGSGTSVYFRDPDGSLLEFISYE